MTKEFDEIRAIFGTPSQKEEAMYEAVIEMVSEKCPIAQIKVSDITKRAGIGKGTAYEYFSSKDEIVVKALLYDTFQSIKKVETCLRGSEKFEDKFCWILIFLEENIGKFDLVNEFLRIGNESFIQYEQSGDRTCQEKKELVCAFVNKMADYYMEQGFREGILAEKNPELRRNCLYAQIMGYVILLLTDYQNGSISPEVARAFTYQCLLKSLN